MIQVQDSGVGELDFQRLENEFSVCVGLRLCLIEVGLLYGLMGKEHKQKWFEPEVPTSILNVQSQEEVVPSCQVGSWTNHSSSWVYW